MEAGAGRPGKPFLLERLPTTLGIVSSNPAMRLSTVSKLGQAEAAPFTQFTGGLKAQRTQLMRNGLCPYSKDGERARNYILILCPTPYYLPNNPSLEEARLQGFGRGPSLLSPHPAPVGWDTCS
jgi:hypothetical protein